MKHLSRRFALLLIGAVLLAALAPRLAAALLLDLAMHQYERVLMATSPHLVPQSFLHMDATAPNTLDMRQSLAPARQQAAWSLSLSGSPDARLAVARIALDSGEYADALRAVEPVLAQTPPDELTANVVLAAASAAGAEQQAVDYYARIPAAYQSTLVRDWAALAYLQLSRDAPDPQPLLQQALRLRPHDLYANNQLRLLALKDGSDPGPYADALAHFQPDAVLPENDGFVASVAQTIPSLIRDGVWDQATADAVLSALVWQHPGSAAVGALLQMLKTAPDLAVKLRLDYHLGEWHAQRGELPQAVDSYAAQAGDPASLRRLAELCGRDRALCDGRAALAPDKLAAVAAQRNAQAAAACAPLQVWGLRCATPDVSPALAASDSAAADSTAARAQAILKTIGQDSAQVALGPELLANSTFDDWQSARRPNGWRILELNYGQGRGAFTGGRDPALSAAGRVPVRLSALWGVQSYSSIGLVYGQEAGSRGVALQPDSRYVLTVDYLADGAASQILTLWSSSPFPLCQAPEDRRTQNTVGLPGTRGVWMQASLLLCAPAGDSVSIVPTVRLWSVGHVWVRAVSLRQLALSRAPLGR